MKKLALVLLFLIIFAGLSFSEQTFQKTKTTTEQKFAAGYSQIPVPCTNNATANNVPSLAARYWFNNDIGIDVTLGFQSGDGDDIFMIGSKFLNKIYNVKNLDIYWLAGIQLGTVSVDNGAGGTSSETALRLMGGVGAEYFILPSLSLLTEVGLCFESVSGDPSISQFKIFADWLPQAGVRFYF